MTSDPRRKFEALNEVRDRCQAFLTELSSQVEQ